MRSSTSLLGRILMGIASEMLEILTKILKIIFNKNIFRVTLKKQRRFARPCFPTKYMIKKIHQISN